MPELPDLDDAKLMLGAAAVILGEDAPATLALARAVTTRRPAHIKRARAALRSLPPNQRAAIAHVVEQTWENEGPMPPRPDQPFPAR